MNNLITKAICFAGLLLFATLANSQTTTINYLTSGLSTSACNVFSPAVSINGVQHTSHAGGVSFNSTNGIVLSTTPQASPPGGTAYVINYNFTSGNNYNISITALGNAALLLKTSVVPNFNQFATNGNSSCTPDGNVSSYQTVGVGQFSSATSTTSTTYNLQQFSVPGGSAYPYLIIWASGGLSNLSLDALSISQVVITQTAVASFTLAPSSVPLSCGSTTAQAFTVTNVNNTPNVTNHLWNLGTTPNNWLLPNGSAAPATYSTATTNTLSLTPVCGAVPSNISVTVTAGGNNYQTNTSSVTVGAPPTLSISGSDIVCSSEVYTLPNLPCGASVTWSLSGQPGPLATLSCTSCDQTTVSVGTGSGNEFLTATITVCGVTQTTATKKIRIGGYTQASPFNTEGLHVWCKNQTSSISVNQTTYPGLTSITWGTVPTGWIYITSGSNYIVLRSTNSTSPPTGTINVTGTDVCGNNTTVGHFMAKSNCTSFRISPNPAKDQITIEEIDDNTGSVVAESNIQAIEIVNRMGILSFRQQYNPKSIGSRLTLRTGQLRNDIYAVRIFDGLEWKSYKVIVSQ